MIGKLYFEACFFVMLFFCLWLLLVFRTAPKDSIEIEIGYESSFSFFVLSDISFYKTYWKYSMGERVEVQYPLKK